jgi:hypothetical protein
MPEYVFVVFYPQPSTNHLSYMKYHLPTKWYITHKTRLIIKVTSVEFVHTSAGGPKQMSIHYSLIFPLIQQLIRSVLQIMLPSFRTVYGHSPVSNTSRPLLLLWCSHLTILVWQHATQDYQFALAGSPGFDITLIDHQCAVSPLIRSYVVLC